MQDNTTPTLKFTNVQDLFDAINNSRGDFLTVTDIDLEQVSEINREREQRRSKIRFRRYDVDTRILFITIPNLLHERLHLQLYRQYIAHLVRNDLGEAWAEIGPTTLRQQGAPRGSGGEGDSAGGPDPERSGLNSWPTLVIEAGDSETLQELHRDMEWWFLASNHDVKIVLLVKFNHQQQQILIERWEEELLVQGPMTRARHAAILQQGGSFQPVKRQEIFIARDETTDPPSYNVVRDPLRLEFRLLFLRHPIPPEADVVISIQGLQRFARKVWAAVPEQD
ncbi:uncharacterized protein C8A04DRAFT_36857 [Dichotomopilus funicola]|uniref:Uncharacterized protein n=1 Tax=Dichotomopilus funicola TaxID=1934379 RepID=A0AAN6V3N3_9PEZI|nr:hypothetical protein C8A04DRAFT_36857 [Dichotomopilus funicola]